MSTLVVHPLEAPLTGSVPVVADPEIGLRALAVAALAEGTTEIHGVLPSAALTSMKAALESLGVVFEEAAGSLRVLGTGPLGLREPPGPIECGDSGIAETTSAVLAGILAGQRFETTLVGAPETRAFARVLSVLRARGALVREKKGADGAVVFGPLPEGKRLGELECESETPDALVKAAVLLSGLYAEGATYFREPIVSPDHTERMLHAFGAPLRVAGTMIALEPDDPHARLRAQSFTVPGDLSAAAFLLVAAQTTKGSRVTVRGVGLNPTRAGVLDIARLMGAGIDVVPHGEQGGEPLGEVTAWNAPLRASILGGEVVARARKDLSLTCVLAAHARGKTVLRDAAELDSVADLLRAFGVPCETLEDGLSVEGSGERLRPVSVESGGDPHRAMIAAILALSSSAPSRIADGDCIARIFPRFVGTLRALGARIDVT